MLKKLLYEKYKLKNRFSRSFDLSRRFMKPSLGGRVVDPDPDPDPGSGSVLDPYWIRIQAGLWIRIRIRNPDPDPGGQK
jgi:hypothetical protein